MKMKSRFTDLTMAVLLVAGAALPAWAEDAATPPKDPPAATTPQTEAPPPSVPRPSIVPKTAEPAAAPVADEPPAAPRRHYAHRRHWRYGYYRTAYWEPFPIYLPHLYRHRIYWSHVPWRIHF